MTEKTCDERLFACLCLLKGEHEVHVCGSLTNDFSMGCGGSWKLDDSEHGFEILTYPGIG